MAVRDRERALGALLAELGYRKASYPVPRVPGLSSPADGWILKLYRELGGIQDHPTLAPRGWDHPLAGLIVELDEGQHFTTYRAVTLAQGWARALPWHDEYRSYIARFDSETSLRYGSAGFWTNPRAEKQFGPSAPARQLSAGGSARWKQRALYDAIRDASAIAGHVNLARLSVYDPVGGRPLGDVLLSPGTADLEALEALIDARTLSDATGSRAPGTSSVSSVPLNEPRDITPSRSQDIEVPSLRQLSKEFGVTEKALRHVLRGEFRPDRSQRGGAWDPLSPEMVSFTRTHYARPSRA